MNCLETSGASEPLQIREIERFFENNNTYMYMYAEQWVVKLKLPINYC